MIVSQFFLEAFNIYQSLTDLSKRVLLKITTAFIKCIYNLILSIEFVILIGYIKIYLQLDIEILKLNSDFKHEKNICRHCLGIWQCSL